MSIVMGMQNFIKMYQKVQWIGPVSLFSKFEPRRNLDLSQISFDNLFGYILSISMCLQIFIKIFFTILEIGPFSLFQNLELDKATTNKNVSVNVYTKVYQNIPLSSRAIVTFFRIWRSAKPRPMKNVILQFVGLDLFNIKLSAKFYQTIPNGLSVNFHFSFGI